MKMHQFYRTYCNHYRGKQRHLAWLYDTILPPFDRKRFRRGFKVSLFLCCSTLVPAVVSVVIWSIVGPFWRRYDEMVDNFVGGFKRIPMGLMGFNALMVMGLIGIGCAHVYALNWPTPIKLSAYIPAVLLIVLLFNVCYRCFERCVFNFCADMNDWED